ncbi:unnamed protein product [Aspergillus oryzae]|nr:unnamed protein product [Aspergillus oryzae]GMF90655.1 unnamed protein product [Aspergillus oryzae]
MSPPAALDNANGSPAAPLTVEGIPALRANSAPIPKGVAPATSSDMFKSPVIPLLLQAIDTSKVCSPGLISLGGGLPSPEYFPFEELDIKVPTPPGFTPEATRESGTVVHAGKSDIREGKSLYG